MVGVRGDAPRGIGRQGCGEQEKAGEARPARGFFRDRVGASGGNSRCNRDRELEGGPTMRHYDRAGYRHLNDGERYRDPEYLADDQWVAPNEPMVMPARDLHDVGAGGGRVDLSGHDAPGPRAGYARAPSTLGAPVLDRHYEPPTRSPERGRREPHGVLHSLLHPAQTVRRAVRGVFSGKGPKNWTRSDQRIHDDVCEMLTHDDHVDASDVEVTVEEGEVMLTGFVPDRRMKHLAEDVIEHIAGVRDVHNRLRIRKE
jgi:hypothetical protein